MEKSLKAAPIAAVVTLTSCLLLKSPNLFSCRVDGKNLLPYLIGKQEAADASRSRPKLTEKDIAVLVKQLLTALQYLHQQNIAYLDIKVHSIIGLLGKLIHTGQLYQFYKRLLIQ